MYTLCIKYSNWHSLWQCHESLAFCSSIDVYGWLRISTMGQFRSDWSLSGFGLLLDKKPFKLCYYCDRILVGILLYQKKWSHREIKRFIMVIVQQIIFKMQKQQWTRHRFMRYFNNKTLQAQMDYSKILNF